jgi:hypothetical protein
LVVGQIPEFEANGSWKQHDEHPEVCRGLEDRGVSHGYFRVVISLVDMLG